MADTVTTYLGLTVPELNTAGYAPKINTDLGLIDTAYGTKTMRLLASGSIASGALSLAVPAPLMASYVLVVQNIQVSGDNSQLFARLDVGAGYLAGASDYEYARRDLTNQGGGTQILDGSAAASAILLTPSTLKGANITTAPRQRLVMQISSGVYNAGTNYDINVEAVSTYRTTAGYRGRSEVSAALVTPPSNAVIGVRVGASLAGNFSQSVALSYALFAYPGLSV